MSLKRGSEREVTAVGRHSAAQVDRHFMLPLEVMYNLTASGNTPLNWYAVLPGLL